MGLGDILTIELNVSVHGGMVYLCRTIVVCTTADILGSLTELRPLTHVICNT